MISSQTSNSLEELLSIARKYGLDEGAIKVMREMNDLGNAFERICILIKRNGDNKNPHRFVEELSRCEDISLRALPVSVAMRGNFVSMEIIRRLARDPEPHIRCLVANFPGTPYTILQGLVEDKDPDVQRIALRNFELIRGARASLSLSYCP